jgi:phosphoribosyl 1,2-cyclic phosphodiesterase
MKDRMTAPPYKLRFWGARGTVATPDAGKLRYGGNTSCLAVELSDHECIILDCGTGVRLLGNRMGERRTDAITRYHVFFTHYHFDHIEGLPLFHPLYDARSHFTFHGFEPDGKSIQQTLEGLITPPYFPVTLADVPSKLEYAPVDGKPQIIADVTVNSLPLNHPDGCLSYRLERGDRRIVYATDHEHGDSRTDDALVRFSEGADYLIYDATYMRAEYEELRKGWGHSTWYAAVQTARAAKVKTLVLFHHHPEHTDDELDEILRVTREELPSVEIASEGMELPL